MSTRTKCKHCLGCMIARWVNNSRYYYCDLCRVWYGGGPGELTEVPDPRKEIKQNDNIDNADSIES